MKYIALLFLLTGCSGLCWHANAGHTCPAITDLEVADNGVAEGK